MAEKFIKKPVVIEAMPFDGSWESAKPILEWIVENKALGLVRPTWFDRADGALRIHTLEGTLTASAGDWIIRGIKGEFYPCTPDIFKETYEPAFTDVQDGPKDSDFCSVCEKALTPDDICATDIELGICHAACLEGSPAVDLDTGEPCETMHTFRYGQLPDDAVGEISTPRHPVVRYRIGIDRGDVFVTGGDYDGMTLVLEAADLSDAQAMLQAISAPAAPEAYHVVFDGFPSPDGPRFIELEDQDGRSLGIGSWRKREDGHAELVLPSAPAPTTTAKVTGYRAEPDFAASIKRTCSEEASNGAACGWMPCTGCYDTEDGHPTAHYRHSRVFGCDVGSGCSECGGLGVVFQYWSPEDLEDMQRDCVSETKTATQDELSYQCDACSVPGYPHNTKCECTSIQQDESCPVGYPSLLCEVCDGKGIIPTPAPHLRVTEAMVNAADSVLSRSRPGIPDETIRFAIEAALAATEGK